MGVTAVVQGQEPDTRGRSQMSFRKSRGRVGSLPGSSRQQHPTPTCPRYSLLVRQMVLSPNFLCLELSPQALQITQEARARPALLPGSLGEVF